MQIREIHFEWEDTHTVFAHESYLKTISNKYGWVGGYIDDRCLFVLPFAIKKRWFLSYLIFTSGAIYSGKDWNLNQEKDFLNGVIEYFKDKGIDFIQQPPSFAVFNTYPDNAVLTSFGSYYIDLTLSESQLWEKMHSKHRNVIRNAEKNAIRIDMGYKNKKIAFDLLKATMNRSEMTFPEMKIYDQFLNDLGNHVEIFVAFKQNVPQGCAVIPFSEFSAYYLWGGSCENPFLGSINLLQWEIIKYFKSIGVKKYDFVGARINPEKNSKLEGIQRFKNRFGTTMRIGFLWKYIYNPFKYKLYRFVLKLKNINRRANGDDIIDQEKKMINHDN